MRLFIAVELDQGMRDTVCAVQEELKKLEVTGHFTERENLHITLAFIGEYPDEEKVLRVMKDVTFEPFDLRLCALGAFGDIWWAGIWNKKALIRLAGKVRRALAEADIPYTRRAMVPHITLVRRAARGKEGLPVIKLPGKKMRVCRITLMRSEQGKNGMIYTPLS